LDQQKITEVTTTANPAMPEVVNNFPPLIIWKEQLLQMGSALHNLATTTESDFLAIGGSITDFYQRACETTDMLSSLIGIMSGDDITHTIDGLRDILARIKENISNVEGEFAHELESLQRTLGIVDTIKSPLENFKKIVKVLKILSISIKIESAQLGQDQAGFVTLADDVEKLSLQINEKLISINASTLLLKGIIEENIAQILSLEKSEQRQVSGTLDTIGLSLTSLEEKNESSRKGTDLISNESGEISRHIGEVVSSMQFHDITRQKIEHAQEVLVGQAEKLRPFLAAETDTGVSSDNHEPAYMDVVSETYYACELQKAQIDDSRKQIVMAIDNIGEHLTRIARNVNEVSQETRNLAGLTDQASSSSLTTIEKGLSAAISSLREGDEASRALSAAMDNFLKTATDMSGFVDAIEDISVEIELIALNARIKTAHTGKEGAPLGVVAEAIQRLSLDANAQKIAVSTTLKDVMSATAEIQSHVRKDLGHQAAENDDMIKNLNEFAGMLRKVNNEIITLLNEVSYSGERLSGDIERLVSSVTVHEKFVTVISDTVSALDSMLAEFRLKVPGVDSKNRSKYLQHLESNYTMQSERKIHTSIMGSKPGHEVHDKTTSHIKPSPEADKELGDNVELF
jgi:methyl-accepting chemotaxis protein